MATPSTRRQRKKQVGARRNQDREQRWKSDRYAVPYRMDRPTIGLSVGWFVSIVVAMSISGWLVAAVVVPVAAIAGLQTGHAWSRYVPSDRRVSALFAAVLALSGLAGTFGLGLGVVVLAFAGLAYSHLGVLHKSDQDVTRFAGVLVRSSLPVGLAAGSLIVLTGRGVGAAIALFLLVSGYEVGDYLVGSGSANAVEGPIAGVAVLAVVGAGLALAKPLPFDGPSAISFSILTAACCPLGQIFGSAILPRGDAWAPGLRRLDSLLLAGPLWLLLL